MIRHYRETGLNQFKIDILTFNFLRFKTPNRIESVAYFPKGVLSWKADEGRRGKRR